MNRNVEGNMSNKDFLNILTAMVAVVLTTGMPNAKWQIIFIIFYLIWIYLFSNYRGQTNLLKKIGCWITGIFCVAIIGFSIYGLGSIENYLKKVVNTFFDVKQNTNSQLSEQYVEYFEDIEEQLIKAEDINEQLKKVNENINILDEDIGNLSNDIKVFYFVSNKWDHSQIDEILGILNEEYYPEEFNDLRNNTYQIELYYKVRLSERKYYYYNVIQAFEKFGINCKKFNIDENDLLVWDLHRLYILYQMKDSIKEQLDSEKEFGKRLNNEDFKIKKEEYGDSIYYKRWGRSYEEYTPKEIDKFLNDEIMDYYDKFMENILINEN